MNLLLISLISNTGVKRHKGVLGEMADERVRTLFHTKAAKDTKGFCGSFFTTKARRRVYWGEGGWARAESLLTGANEGNEEGNSRLGNIGADARGRMSFNH